MAEISSCVLFFFGFPKNFLEHKGYNQHTVGYTFHFY